MVLAPEHPFVERLTQPEQAEAVRAYCEQAARKSDLDRTDLAKEKTGVFTGSFAANPVNSRPVPIWVADYVLASYGTGAIMAVPAHDTRDFEFAVEFELPIMPVVDPGEDAADVDRAKVLAGKAVFTGEGTAINSGAYDGLSTAEFKQQHHRRPGRTGQGTRGRQLQAARLALQPAALLGRAVPDPARAGRRRQADRHDPHRAGRRAAGEPARAGGVRHARQPRAAAGQGARGMAVRRDRWQPLQARNEHDAAMGRLLLVLSCGFSTHTTSRRWSTRR